MNNLTQPIVPLNFTGIEVQNLASKFVLDIRPQSPLSGRTVSKRGTYLKFKKKLVEPRRLACHPQIWYGSD